MTYYTYPLMMSKCERMMLRNHVLKINKKQRGMDSLKEAIRYLLVNEKAMYQTIDIVMMMEEWHWLQNKQVIFPENKTLLNRLLKATSRIKDPERLFKDEQSFMLALPKDFKIGSLPATGVLVTVCRWDNRKIMLKGFFDWLNLDNPGMKKTDSRMTVCITYQHPGDVSNMYYRAIIPIPYMQKLLSAETGEEYWKILGNFEASPNKGYHDLTFDQAAYQQTLVKLILAILLYKKTSPQALVSGYPVKNKRPPKMDKIVTKNYQGLTLSMPHQEHDGPSFHYRSWTFRQLFDKRYYQGEYQNMEPGSRIVFVRDTFVNMGDVQPTTLKDKC